MHVNVKSATVLEKNQVKNKQHHKKQSYTIWDWETDNLGLRVSWEIVSKECCLALIQEKLPVYIKSQFITTVQIS